MKQGGAFVLVLLFAGSMGIAEPPTRPATAPVDPFLQLAARMPETLSDPRIKTFDTIVRLQMEGVPAVVRVRRTETGKTSVYVEYSKRHVPLIFGVDREMFQYDTAFGVLRRMHNVRAKLLIKTVDGEFTVNAGVHHSEKPTTQPSPTLDAEFNFRSFMEDSQGDVTVTPDGPLEILWGRTSKRGNPVQFWVDPRREFPLVACVLKNKDGPFCIVSRIDLNQPVDEAGMVMP